jgi:hypothetical protein
LHETPTRQVLNVLAAAHGKGGSGR